MAKCVLTLKACQAAEERKPYGFNWTSLLARFWTADTPFAAGVKVRPTTATGFQYSSSGGQSGPEEPSWPAALGATVVDGAITWTCEALAADSLADGIDSDDWNADVGITVDPDSPVVSGGLQRTSAKISGGTPGTTYLIDSEIVTDAGLEYLARLELKIV